LFSVPQPARQQTREVVIPTQGRISSVSYTVIQKKSLS